MDAEDELEPPADAAVLPKEQAYWEAAPAGHDERDQFANRRWVDRAGVSVLFAGLAVAFILCGFDFMRMQSHGVSCSHPSLNARLTAFHHHPAAVRVNFIPAPCAAQASLREVAENCNATALAGLIARSKTSSFSFLEAKDAVRTWQDPIFYG